MIIDELLANSSIFLLDLSLSHKSTCLVNLKSYLIKRISSYM